MDYNKLALEMHEKNKGKKWDIHLERSMISEFLLSWNRFEKGFNYLLFPK